MKDLWTGTVELGASETSMDRYCKDLKKIGQLEKLLEAKISQCGFNTQKSSLIWKPVKDLWAGTVELGASERSMDWYCRTGSQ